MNLINPSDLCHFCKQHLSKQFPKTFGKTLSDVKLGDWDHQATDYLSKNQIMYVIGCSKTRLSIINYFKVIDLLPQFVYTTRLMRLTWCHLCHFESVYQYQSSRSGTLGI